MRALSFRMRRGARGPAIQAAEARRPGAPAVVGRFPMLNHTAVRLRRPADALSLHATVRGWQLTGQYHGALAQAALQTQHHAVAADPELSPHPMPHIPGMRLVPWLPLAPRQFSRSQQPFSLRSMRLRPTRWSPCGPPYTSHLPNQKSNWRYSSLVHRIGGAAAATAVPSASASKPGTTPMSPSLSRCDEHARATAAAHPAERAPPTFTMPTLPRRTPS